MKTRHFVIYCTMDQELGANPLWHTFVMTGKLEAEAEKIEITGRWGFYGLRTNAPKSTIESLQTLVKKYIGMDVYFYDNFGLLIPERLRYLDTGSGLHGVPFEVTEDQYNAFFKKASDRITKQNALFDEIKKIANLKPRKDYRVFELEDYSLLINQYENALAQLEGRSPRVKPFSFSFRDPHTCKMMALDLCRGILTDEQVEHITGWHQAVSRWSGEMETIHLHSTGPFTTFKKPNGDVIYNRDENSSEAKLWMTVPPQMMNYISDEAKELFEIPYDHANEVKEMVRMLQKLSTVFRNARLDADHHAYRDALVGMLVKSYESFAVTRPKKSVAKNDSWGGYFNWRLFGEPRDGDEADVKTKLTQGTRLIEALKHSIEHAGKDGAVSDLDNMILNLQPKQFDELCQTVGTQPHQDEEDLLRALC